MKIPNSVTARLRAALEDAFGSKSSSLVRQFEDQVNKLDSEDYAGLRELTIPYRDMLARHAADAYNASRYVSQPVLDEADVVALRKYLEQSGVDMSEAARTQRAAEQGYLPEVYGRGVGSPHNQFYGINHSLEHFGADPSSGHVSGGYPSTVHAAPLDEPWQWMGYSSAHNRNPINWDQAFDVDPDEMYGVDGGVRPYNVFIRTREMPSRVLDGQGASVNDVELPWNFDSPFVAQNVRDWGADSYMDVGSMYRANTKYPPDYVNGDVNPGTLGDPLEGPLGTQYGFDVNQVRSIDAMYLPQFVGRRGMLLGGTGVGLSYGILDPNRGPEQ